MRKQKLKWDFNSPTQLLKLFSTSYTRRMKLILGADHRGFELKEHLRQWLTNQGHEVIDSGSFELNQDDDYPVIGFAAADELKNITEPALGIVICGSGVGIAIAANKVNGIRCALGFSAEQIAASRREDNINMLSLPAEYISSSDAEKIVEAFMTTPFAEKEKYVRRIAQIESREQGT
jgi:ribose 5-phosphate isomerase B